MYPIKQSTAITVPFFVHDAAGDAVTGLTDGSFTKRISKGSGAFAAMTVTITEMENGWYSIPLSTAHSDTLGLLTIVFTNAGAKQVNLQFRVSARLPDDLAYPTTSGRSIDVTAGGTVGIDWGNVENPTTAVDLSATDIQLCDTITTYTGNTVQTGDSFARLGAPAGASVSADIATAQADLDIITGTTGVNIENGSITDASFDTTAGDFHSLGVVDQGTAQAATATTLQLRAAAAFADDELLGAVILITGGTTGVGQTRTITDYVSATDTATVDTWTTTPSGTITYKVFASPPAPSTPASVNVTQISGDATAADNCEAFFDGTGYAGTNNVIPTVTTLTGHTAQTGDSFARLGAPAGASVSADVAAVKTDTAAILVDTAEIGVAGAGLTNINLPNQTMDITGNITGNLSGSVGSVTGAVGSVTGNVGGNVTGSVGSNLELGPAEVNAEVVDALNTDTYAEPGQGAPGATISLAAKIGYIYKAWRNRSTQTATQYSLYNDDATTIDHKATVSDDNTTADKGEVGTGP